MTARVAIEQGDPRRMDRAVQLGKNRAWPDVDRLRERLEREYRLARGRARSDRLELYHRLSATLRIGRSRESDRDEIRFGVDEGLAIRMRPGDRQESRFAAASGFDPRGVLALALSGAGGSPNDEAWCAQPPSVTRDVDDRLELPTVDGLRNWLSAASDRLASTAVRPTVARVWLEVASTVESWASDGGIVASRGRQRAWAMAEVAPGGVDEPSTPPLIVASRSWEGLPADGWARIRTDRVAGAPGSASTTGPGTVVFTSEEAAKLVRALTLALHGDPSCIGRPVGPGWRLADDPSDPEAIFGGAFDDCCFPTGRRELADGVRVTGSVVGPGCYRRASYRDLPEARASHLLVSAVPRLELPRRGLLVSRLSIHALAADDWVLDVAGCEIAAGELGPAFRGHLRVDPWRLVRHCAASQGTPSTSHRGVRTAALVFEHLEVSRVP